MYGGWGGWVIPAKKVDEVPVDSIAIVLCALCACHYSNGCPTHPIPPKTEAKKETSE